MKRIRIGRAAKWAVPAAAAASAIAVSMGGFLPAASANTVSGAITAADGVQTGRLARTLQQTSCTNPVLEGLFNSDPHYYDSYRYVNLDRQPRCATITLTSLDLNCNVMAAAYRSFDPGNIVSNLVGQAGVSSLGNTAPSNTTSFSVLVPAGGRLTVTVNSVANLSTCNAYSLTVDPGGKPGVTPVS